MNKDELITQILYVRKLIRRSTGGTKLLRATELELIADLKLFCDEEGCEVSRYI
jgi:hypothetical protein